MSSRPAITENEWICGGSRCQQVNSGNNTCCEFCGRSKPRGKGQVGHEIGKEAAEKSKGLFAAEDWSCSKCGNINWARRLQCNICNAAKCGEVEARTGYGGGYMDRQQVERRRNTSDDEYDHFGRRKKKANNNESAVRKNETAERKTAGNSSSGAVDTEKSKKRGSCSVSDDTSSSELSSPILQAVIPLQQKDVDIANVAVVSVAVPAEREVHLGRQEEAVHLQEVIVVTVGHQRRVAAASLREVAEVAQWKNGAAVDSALPGTTFVRRQVWLASGSYGTRFVPLLKLCRGFFRSTQYNAEKANLCALNRSVHSAKRHRGFSHRLTSCPSQ
ncbi:hypothetical protein D918_02640 [Trichuris suis]|nr:hypothetical protein D918_02640 [Trichuris suis]